MAETLDSLAEKLNSIVILGEDNWRLALLSMASPHAPRIQLSGISIRNNLHLLLAGDVSSAKSQTLNIIKKIAPKWELVTKATAASMEGDAIHKNIRAGILEQTNGGVILVPEFQAAVYSRMQILREALDGSELRIHKRGQIRIFVPNITIMAGCNPSDDFFIEGQQLRDQVKFGEAILSRFDVVIPTLSTPELNAEVVDHMRLFGSAPVDVSFSALHSFFQERTTQMQLVTRVSLDAVQQDSLKNAFRKHNQRPNLARRPFLILRDLEILMRLVNSVACFNHPPDIPGDTEAYSTCVVEAAEDDIELAISLWEHILNMRSEFYTETERRIVTLPEVILQTVHTSGGSARVETVRQDVCEGRKLCSPATFYRKLNALEQEGKINHKKGPDATINILGSYTE